MKLNKKMAVLTGLLCLVPVLIGLIFWNELPDAMPTHFGANNEPDGWSSKPFAVFGLPFIIMALHYLCIFGTLADPKKTNISGKMFSIVLWICPVISILCSSLTYAFALGHSVNIGFAAMLLIGIVLIIVGNYLPKSRQNYTVGIKIPWTLNDTENWNATHRFGGRVFIAAGVIVLCLSWAQPQWLIVPVMIAAAVAPMLYSYLYYCRHSK